MEAATFRFYGELREYLSKDYYWGEARLPLKDRVSVKHVIEAAGVPHTEVELIIVDGTSVDFSYLVRDGDRIAVYPHFGTFDVGTLITVRPPIPNPHRFVLDNHLGRLASYLRLLGFDTLYYSDGDDVHLAQIAHQERRILLTRDRGLLKRRLVTYGYCVRSRDTHKQLAAVLHRFALWSQVQPWRRCLRCNCPLENVDKESIQHRLEPRTRAYYNEFHWCPDCDQIYWKGSHYTRMQRYLEDLLN